LQLARLTAEFTDAAVELRFRRLHFHAAARQAVVGLLVAAFFTLAFGYNDYVFLGICPAFWLLLGGRLAFTAVALAGVVMLVRRPERVCTGVVVSTVSAALLASVVLVVLVRPANLHWHFLIWAVCVLGVYLATPNRFILSAGVALGCTLGLMVGVGLVVRPSLMDTLRMVLILGAANAVGYLTSYHFNRLRRLQFALLLKAEEANQALLREVAERRRLEAELLRMASTDGLTGLFNRRHFLELANRELARARRAGTPISLLLLDVDHFKEVNDRHGHAAGDLALKAVGEACRAALREVDVVGRLGGEEFAACLPEAGEDGAVEVAERLRRTLAALRVETPAGPLSLTVTIGVAAVRAEETDVTQALQRADDAMYAGKRAGRDRVMAAGAPTAAGDAEAPGAQPPRACGGTGPHKG
jgi:diguanylate cyclase (GGDEF)-like protein